MQNVAPEAAALSLRSLRFGGASAPGRFELQPKERRLLADGKPVALGGRALDLLIALAAQPDHLFRKNDLIDRVWPGLVVEEANLQVQISNLRKLLGADVIATVPGRGYRFVAVVEAKAEAKAAAATDAAPAPKPAEPPPSGLASPASTRAVGRLFGRDADLGRLDALLQGDGCVTLVGTSGVGKTSLARAVASRWPGRTAWLDLAPLTEGVQIAATLARVLGVQLGGGEPVPQLMRALQANDTLVVFDNAEHLVEACAELVTLFGTVPGVRVLVTSQLPLAVTGERVQRLDPLPTATAGDGAELGDGALALLVDRIRAADQRFAVKPAMLPVLRAICAQLDGLPLALEMAAARVPLLGLQGVHDALAERFSLLTRGHRDAPARHRTLHNALEWSYRLLEEPEQRLFRAMGVCAGGFTLDLAVALATDTPAARWDAIESLATLVDRSLVTVSVDDPPRYRLLETMRAFALEQLAQSADPIDEAARVRRRHARALLALFGNQVVGDEARTAAYVAEMENAREAIAWARGNDLLLAVQLATQASTIATFTVWRHEVTQWLQSFEPLLVRESAQALPPRVQAMWWTHFARTLSMRNDLRSIAAARRAFELWQALQQPREALYAAVVWVRSCVEPGAELDYACAQLQSLAATLSDLSASERLRACAALAKAALTRGDLAAVLAGRLEEVRLARELGWTHAVEAAESNVMNTLNHLRRHVEAAELGRALLARIDANDGAANGNLPWVFSGLIEALLGLGRLEEAHALVPRACEAGQRFDALVTAPLLAALAAAQKRFAAAARLVGYARHEFASRGMSLEPGEEETLAGALAEAKAALGAERADALVQEGRQLGDAAAAALTASNEA